MADWHDDTVDGEWNRNWDDDGSVCPNNTLDYWDERFDDWRDYEGDELPFTQSAQIKMWFWDKQDKLKGLWHKLMVKLHLAKEEEIPF